MIETLYKLTEISKELLDLCKEQAEILESLDLVTEEKVMKTREQIEKARRVFEKYSMCQDVCTARDLTESEANIYDEILNAESAETGIKLF